MILNEEAKKAGWHRFTPVTESVPQSHRLYRASAPNYDEDVGDSSQNLTQAATDYLVSQRINSIISFNEYEYKPEMKERLKKAKINYKHIKLEDFDPPTFAQFEDANAFFLRNKSTLVHCGYGWGRTGTGITGLQLYAENGRKLDPPACLWVTSLDEDGNNVEMRVQVSALCELRNHLFPRLRGVPPGNPQQALAVINLATGYYLRLLPNKPHVVSRAAERVEETDSIPQEYQWAVSKDKSGSYTLSNKTQTSFALTKRQGAAVGDLVTYGSQAEGNALFTITETTGGHYIISPSSNPALVVATDVPPNVKVAYSTQGSEIPVKLESKNNDKKLKLWILLPVNLRAGLHQAELEGEQAATTFEDAQT